VREHWHWVVCNVLCLFLCCKTGWVTFGSAISLSISVLRFGWAEVSVMVFILGAVLYPLNVFVLSTRVHDFFFIFCGFEPGTFVLVLSFFVSVGLQLVGLHKGMKNKHGGCGNGPPGDNQPINMWYFRSWYDCVLLLSALPPVRQSWVCSIIMYLCTFGFRTVGQWLVLGICVLNAFVFAICVFFTFESLGFACGNFYVAMFSVFGVIFPDLGLFDNYNFGVSYLLAWLNFRSKKPRRPFRVYLMRELSEAVETGKVKKMRRVDFTRGVGMHIFSRAKHDFVLANYTVGNGLVRIMACLVPIARFLYDSGYWETMSLHYLFGTAASLAVIYTIDLRLLIFYLFTMVNAAKLQIISFTVGTSMALVSWLLPIFISIVTWFALLKYSGSFFFDTTYIAFWVGTLQSVESMFSAFGYGYQGLSCTFVKVVFVVCAYVLNNSLFSALTVWYCAKTYMLRLTVWYLSTNLGSRYREVPNMVVCILVSFMCLGSFGTTISGMVLSVGFGISAYFELFATRTTQRAISFLGGYSENMSIVSNFHNPIFDGLLALSELLIFVSRTPVVMIVVHAWMQSVYYTILSGLFTCFVLQPMARQAFKLTAETFYCTAGFNKDVSTLFNDTIPVGLLDEFPHAVSRATIVGFYMSLVHKPLVLKVTAVFIGYVLSYLGYDVWIPLTIAMNLSSMIKCPGFGLGLMLIAFTIKTTVGIPLSKILLFGIAVDFGHFLARIAAISLPFAIVTITLIVLAVLEFGYGSLAFTLGKTTLGDQPVISLFIDSMWSTLQSLSLYNYMSIFLLPILVGFVYGSYAIADRHKTRHFVVFNWTGFVVCGVLTAVSGTQSFFGVDTSFMSPVSNNLRWLTSLVSRPIGRYVFSCFGMSSISIVAAVGILVATRLETVCLKILVERAKLTAKRRIPGIVCNDMVVPDSRMSDVAGFFGLSTHVSSGFFPPQPRDDMRVDRPVDRQGNFLCLCSLNCGNTTMRVGNRFFSYVGQYYPIGPCDLIRGDKVPFNPNTPHCYPKYRIKDTGKTDWLQRLFVKVPSYGPALARVKVFEGQVVDKLEEELEMQAKCGWRTVALDPFPDFHWSDMLISMIFPGLSCLLALSRQYFSGACSVVYGFSGIVEKGLLKIYSTSDCSGQPVPNDVFFMANCRYDLIVLGIVVVLCFRSMWRFSRVMVYQASDISMHLPVRLAFIVVGLLINLSYYSFFKVPSVAAILSRQVEDVTVELNALEFYDQGAVVFLVPFYLWVIFSSVVLISTLFRKELKNPPCAMLESWVHDTLYVSVKVNRDYIETETTGGVEKYNIISDLDAAMARLFTGRNVSSSLEDVGENICFLASTGNAVMSVNTNVNRKIDLVKTPIASHMVVLSKWKTWLFLSSSVGVFAQTITNSYYVLPVFVSIFFSFWLGNEFICFLIRLFYCDSDLFERVSEKISDSEVEEIADNICLNGLCINVAMLVGFSELISINTALSPMPNLLDVMSTLSDDFKDYIDKAENVLNNKHSAAVTDKHFKVTEYRACFTTWQKFQKNPTHKNFLLAFRNSARYYAHFSRMLPWMQSINGFIENCQLLGYKTCTALTSIIASHKKILFGIELKRFCKVAFGNQTDNEVVRVVSDMIQRINDKAKRLVYMLVEVPGNRNVISKGKVEDWYSFPLVATFREKLGLFKLRVGGTEEDTSFTVGSRTYTNPSGTSMVNWILRALSRTFVAVSYPVPSDETIDEYARTGNVSLVKEYEVFVFLTMSFMLNFQGVGDSIGKFDLQKLKNTSEWNLPAGCGKMYNGCTVRERTNDQFISKEILVTMERIVANRELIALPVSAFDKMERLPMKEYCVSQPPKPGADGTNPIDDVRLTSKPFRMIFQPDRVSEILRSTVGGMMESLKKKPTMGCLIQQFHTSDNKVSIPRLLEAMLWDPGQRFESWRWRTFVSLSGDQSICETYLNPFGVINTIQWIMLHFEFSVKAVSIMMIFFSSLSVSVVYIGTMGLMSIGRNHSGHPATTFNNQVHVMEFTRYSILYMIRKLAYKSGTWSVVGLINKSLARSTAGEFANRGVDLDCKSPMYQSFVLASWEHPPLANRYIPHFVHYILDSFTYGDDTSLFVINMPIEIQRTDLFTVCLQGKAKDREAEEFIWTRDATVDLLNDFGVTAIRRRVGIGRIFFPYMSFCEPAKEVARLFTEEVPQWNTLEFVSNVYKLCRGGISWHQDPGRALDSLQVGQVGDELPKQKKMSDGLSTLDLTDPNVLVWFYLNHLLPIFFRNVCSKFWLHLTQRVHNRIKHRLPEKVTLLPEIWQYAEPFTIDPRVSPLETSQNLATASRMVEDWNSYGGKEEALEFIDSFENLCAVREFSLPKKVMLSGETGSGKTVNFLIPAMIQAAKQGYSVVSFAPKNVVQELCRMAKGLAKPYGIEVLYREPRNLLDATVKREDFALGKIVFCVSGTVFPYCKTLDPSRTAVFVDEVHVAVELSGLSFSSMRSLLKDFSYVWFATATPRPDWDITGLESIVAVKRYESAPVEYTYLRSQLGSALCTDILSLVKNNVSQPIVVYLPSIGAIRQLVFVLAKHTSVDMYQIVASGPGKISVTTRGDIRFEPINISDIVATRNTVIFSTTTLTGITLRDSYGEMCTGVVVVPMLRVTQDVSGVNRYTRLPDCDLIQLGGRFRKGARVFVLEVEGVLPEEEEMRKSLYGGFMSVLSTTGPFQVPENLVLLLDSATRFATGYDNKDKVALLTPFLSFLIHVTIVGLDRAVQDLEMNSAGFLHRVVGSKNLGDRVSNISQHGSYEALTMDLGALKRLMEFVTTVHKHSLLKSYSTIVEGKLHFRVRDKVVVLHPFKPSVDKGALFVCLGPAAERYVAAFDSILF